MSLRDLYTTDQALNCSALRAKVTNLRGKITNNAESLGETVADKRLFIGECEYQTNPSFSATINVFTLLDTYVENHHQPLKRLLASSKTRMSSILLLLVASAFVLLLPLHSMIVFLVAGAFALVSIVTLVVNYFAKKGLHELSIAVELQSSIAVDRDAVIIESPEMKNTELVNLYETITAMTELSDDLSNSINQFIALSTQIQSAVKGQEFLKQNIKKVIDANLRDNHIRETGDLFQIVKNFVGGNYHKDGQEVNTMGTLHKERSTYTQLGLFNPNEHTTAAGVRMPETLFARMLAEVLSIREKLASRDVEELRRAYHGSNAERTALRTELSQVNARLREESEEKLDLHKRNVELSIQIAAKHQQSLDMLVQLQAREAELSALQNETQALSEQLARATAQRQIAQSENGEKATVVDALQTRLEALQASFQQKEVEIESKAEEITRLQKLHAAEMESQQQTASDELEKARQELARVQSSQEERNNRKNVTHEQEQTKLKSAFNKEIENLRSTFEINLQIKETEISSLGSAQQALSKQIETLKQELGYYRCESLSHQNNHRQVLVRHAELESQLLQANTKVGELEANVQALDEELAVVSKAKDTAEKELTRIVNKGKNSAKSSAGFLGLFAKRPAGASASAATAAAEATVAAEEGAVVADRTVASLEEAAVAPVAAAL